MGKLSDKTFIIVGASGGIGSVLAREFLAEGANVVLAARNEEKLLALKKSLGSGEKILTIKTDATSISDLERLFEKSYERFGSVDAIVISVGTWARLSIDSSPEEVFVLFDKHYTSILKASILPAFIAQRFFIKQDHGLVAGISSHAAVRQLTGNLSYGPMKAAQRQFMLAIREELAGSGVKVTNLMPAIVKTPGNSEALDTEEKRRAAVQPEEIADWIIDHIDDPNIPAEHLFDSELQLD